MVSIIRYDNIVYNSGIIIDLNEEIQNNLITGNNKEGKACFYDALTKLASELSINYLSTIEGKDKKYKINSIDVIGMGRCLDNCSKIGKFESIGQFFDSVYNKNINTKYFCLLEENIVNAAEVGFNTIGVIKIKPF